MPYSGNMTARTVVAIDARRATAAAVAVTLCFGVGAPGALAQSQTLPDPDDRVNAAQDTRSAQSNGGSGQSGLPQTGVFAAPLLAAGLALLATGVATRPARRRRRAYRCDAWWDEVTAPPAARQPERRSE